MGEVLTALVPYAVAVTLSPLPILAVLLALPSAGGRASGAALLGGRIVGVALVVVLATLLADLVPQRQGPTPVVDGLRVVLGLVLVGWAISKGLSRFRGGGSEQVPRWLSAIEDLTVAGAARLGFVLSVANPKELVFGLGAGLLLGASALTVGPTVLLVLIYTLLACAGVAVPVVASAVAGERVRAPLEAARTWLVANNTLVIAGVLLIIGALVIGKGVGGLIG